MDKLDVGSVLPVGLRDEARDVTYCETPPLRAALPGAVVDDHVAQVPVLMDDRSMHARVHVVEIPRESSPLAGDGDEVANEDRAVPSVAELMEIHSVLTELVFRLRQGLPNDPAEVIGAVSSAGFVLGWEECGCVELNLDSRCPRCMGTGYLRPEGV